MDPSDMVARAVSWLVSPMAPSDTLPVTMRAIT
jgi:hypothetical protein